jgi:fatty-acyl-CoA synthase
VGLLGAALLFAIGLLVLAMGPALYRAHVLDLDAATLGVARVSLFAIAPAAVISAVVLVISLFARSTRGAIASILLLLASGLAGFRVYGFFVQRDWMPPLHEAQTDWADPVAISDALVRTRLLANAAPLTEASSKIPEGHGRWSGMTPAEAQAGFFTDIAPLRERVSLETATKAAAAAAETLGWRVERTDPAAGVMEASHRSAWYGLASDIVVRARVEGDGGGEGVRIDIRSVSRTDGPDLGANASRVTQMKDAIAFQLRSAGKAPS